ncbi:MAG: LacI family DNA-binding transcriptional regulator [Salinibacter sp.]
MPPTIYDIAEQADVSTATVSRVLNDESKVAADTRERVLEAAQSLGYQPHASARNLARKCTNTIGVVVPLLANYFYMGVLRGIQQSLASKEYDLLVHAPSHPDQIEEQVRSAAQRGRSDGFMLLSAPLHPGIVQCLQETSQSIVLVDTKHPEFESIYVNNHLGGYKATQHLMDLGYQRIGHITSGTPEPDPAHERRMGYEEALGEGNYPRSSSLIARGNQEPFAFAKDGGYRAMKELLQRDPPPDAVFVASDMQAIGALHAATDGGYRVPEDVALLGFDDIEVGAHVGLSTMRQPLEEYGRLATEKLTDRVENPGRPVSSTVFDPQVVVRETCGGVPDIVPSNGESTDQRS